LTTTRPLIATACAAILSLGLLAAPATAAPAPAVVARVVTPTDLDAAEKTILTRTNALRAASRRAPLVRQASLDAVALRWARQLATGGSFRHNPNLTSQIPAGWRAAGENIAWTTAADATSLYTQWKNSAGHRANMVSASYNRIGLAVVKVGNRSYGVQVFGGYR